VLVEAERLGQDVDSAPAFAALLRHLDHCAACLARYRALAEDLDALFDMAGPPQNLPSPPAFFTPPEQRQGADPPTAPGGL
jgi:anti-sigma factor RsiW